MKWCSSGQKCYLFQQISSRQVHCQQSLHHLVLTIFCPHPHRHGASCIIVNAWPKHMPIAPRVTLATQHADKSGYSPRFMASTGLHTVQTIDREFLLMQCDGRRWCRPSRTNSPDELAAGFEHAYVSSLSWVLANFQVHHIAKLNQWNARSRENFDQGWVAPLKSI